MKFIAFLLSLVTVVSLSNCTVQKRVHRKGWNVSWNKSFRTEKDKTAKTDLIASPKEKNKKKQNVTYAKTNDNGGNFQLELRPRKQKERLIVHAEKVLTPELPAFVQRQTNHLEHKLEKAFDAGKNPSEKKDYKFIILLSVALIFIVGGFFLFSQVGVTSAAPYVIWLIFSILVLIMLVSKLEKKKKAEEEQ